jgi:hypothetical protein
LIVLVLVGAAASFVAASLNLRLRVTRQEAVRVRLAALSDAALAEALASLAQNVNFLGSAEYAFGRGIIGSEVATIDPGSEPTVEIVASARFGGHSKRVRAEAKLTATGPVVLSWSRIP